MFPHIKSVRRSAGHNAHIAINLHKQLKVLIALYSLMKLQYEHEGHIDDHVMSHYDMLIFGIEEQFAGFTAGLELDTLPF